MLPGENFEEVSINLILSVEFKLSLVLDSRVNLKCSIILFYSAEPLVAIPLSNFSTGEDAGVLLKTSTVNILVLVLRIVKLKLGN